MRRHQGYRGLAPADQGAAVAIGNFDGVHRGHQAVLALARAEADALGAPLGVVTFEPHPRAFFDPACAPFRLMTADARARRLAELGVEQLYELPFDADLAAHPAEDFVREVLAEGLRVRAVVAGSDFRFGRGRAGDVGLLARMGPALGFSVVVAPLLADGGAVSSTAVRAALDAGDVEAAERLLGRWPRMEGVVEHGDARGRELGFPTANLRLDRLHLPRFGVYAGLAEALDGPHRGRWPAAVSIGVRPTFGGDAEPKLEAYLLDFSGDLYGTTLAVALVAWLRPELRFDGVAPLVAQMTADVEETRRRLAATLAF